jgi:hypothetical protein
MRVLFLTLIVLSSGLKAQQDSMRIPESSILKRLGLKDSITFYQCHVEEAVQQLATVSGQTLTGKPQRYSITEKYVIRKMENGLQVDYYSSSLNVLPNRKFSGLKIREMPYWEFKKEKTFLLSPTSLRVLLALEKKGHEAIEYDFAITKHNTNQVIIRHRKDFKQLVIEGNYVISKLITM